MAIYIDMMCSSVLLWCSNICYLIRCSYGSTNEKQGEYRMQNNINHNEVALLIGFYDQQYSTFSKLSNDEWSEEICCFEKLFIEKSRIEFKWCWCCNLWHLLSQDELSRKIWYLVEVVPLTNVPKRCSAYLIQQWTCQAFVWRCLLSPHWS
jgi:hypothetical protein